MEKMTVCEMNSFYSRWSRSHENPLLCFQNRSRYHDSFPTNATFPFLFVPQNSIDMNNDTYLLEVPI